METYMKKIMILLFITALISACSRASATEAPTAVPQLNISDPAKNLEATAGNEFKIIIDSNPTTGYHWEIVGELDANVIEFISNDFRGSEPVMPGSGGVDVWVFKAVAAGETKITLGYYPPSNDPVEPQQKVTFTVTVK
jgi:inhibitor of cysteine peptidase